MYKIGDRVKLRSLIGLIIGRDVTLRRVYTITEFVPYGDMMMLDDKILVMANRVKKVEDEK